MIDDDLNGNTPEVLSEAARNFVDAINDKFQEVSIDERVRSSEGADREQVTAIPTELPHYGAGEPHDWRFTLYRPMPGSDATKTPQAILRRPEEPETLPVHYFIKNGKVWQQKMDPNPRALGFPPTTHAQLAQAMRQNIQGHREFPAEVVDFEDVGILADTIRTSLVM